MTRYRSIRTRKRTSSRTRTPSSYRGGNSIVRESKALGTANKGLANIRKSLIEANRQALLAADELEDLQFNDPEAVSALGDDAFLLDNASECMRSIAACVQKAVEYSDQAKTIIRGLGSDATPTTQRRAMRTVSAMQRSGELPRTSSRNRSRRS